MFLPHFQDLLADYNCSCLPGYSGTNCDQEEGVCVCVQERGRVEFTKKHETITFMDSVIL